MMQFSNDPTPRAGKSAEEIDNDICELLYRHGPDRHIDGHWQIAEYVRGTIAAERESCAKIAKEHGERWIVGSDRRDEAEEIEGAIRARGK